LLALPEAIFTKLSYRPSMEGFVHALGLFWGQVSSVLWPLLVLGIVCHLAKMGCRARAWQGILAAAYPDAGVRWRDVAGAYVAGVGVNALVPVRGGDLVKLYLVKRRIPGSTYATLASTFAVEMVFDIAAALALLGWAISQGVLPGLDVLPRLPALDLAWIIAHPLAFAAMALGTVALLAVVVWKASPHVGALGRRLAQGFAIFGDWRAYVSNVAVWQLADWLLRIATIFCFLGAFGVGIGTGIVDGLGSALLVQVTQSVAALLPLTPSGIGTEQALIVYVFAGKVSTAALIGYSVGMQIVLVVVNVIVGFGAILLTLGTLRWRRHLELERQAALPVPAEAPAEP
jgi:hypothetical protein